jgi:hypothetical protein
MKLPWRKSLDHCAARERQGVGILMNGKESRPCLDDL